MAANDVPKVKLYWLEQSRAQRIVWLLEELNVPYELELFRRTKDMLADERLTEIHPLGKSPVISVTPPASVGGDPIVLAESGHITQYLTEHLAGGGKLLPKRWKDGLEGKIGGDTDAWLRHQYYMHYCEGSFMPFLVMTLVIGRLKSSMVPFIVRPITTAVANRVFSTYIFPNVHRHLAMIEGDLASSPDGGQFLCGDKLTAVDILMSFPLVAAKGRLDEVGPWKEGSWLKEFPRVAKYLELLESQEGYKRSVQKVEEMEKEKKKESK